MNDHVSKPIDPDLLYETVARHFTPRPGEASAARAPVAVLEELPVVEGLDGNDGLLRVAGNRALYLKMLRQFAAQQADAPARIAAHLAAGENDVAERIAHTVRGVAGNLGARAVQLAAAELESTLRSGTPPEAALAHFEALLVPLARDLHAALGEAAEAARPAPVAIDPAQLKDVLEEMHRHLSEFDAASADCLDANRALFATVFPGEDFTRFERSVRDYDFGEALAQLQRALPEGR